MNMEENNDLKGAQIQAKATEKAGNKGLAGTLLGALIGAVVTLVCTNISSNTTSLSVQYTSLKEDYDSLLTRYNELEEDYNELEKEYERIVSEQYWQEYDVTKDEVYVERESDCLFVVSDLYNSIGQASLDIYYGTVDPEKVNNKYKNHVFVSIGEPILFDKNGDYSLTLLSIEDDDDHCRILIKRNQTD